MSIARVRQTVLGIAEYVKTLLLHTLIALCRIRINKFIRNSGNYPKTPKKARKLRLPSEG